MAPPPIASRQPTSYVYQAAPLRSPSTASPSRLRFAPQGSNTSSPLPSPIAAAHPISHAHTTSHERYPSSTAAGGGGAVLLQHVNNSSVTVASTQSGRGTLSKPSSQAPRRPYAKSSSARSAASSMEKVHVSSFAAVFSTPHNVYAQLGDGNLHDGTDDDDAAYRSYKESRHCTVSYRGFVNVVTLGLLIASLLALFAGYPIIQHFRQPKVQKNGAYNLGGTNGTGQVPLIHPHLQLVDVDTPTSAMKWTSPVSKDKFHIVFSDEFEQEGRTFWPGDDPFWEAVDLWYGATGNYEWYHPGQVNTTGGALQITMEQKPMNDLNFRSGMLQSWNKFCFQGGYIEFSATLPGSPDEVGWWPGLWMQGNLGRPGYLGTTDGMWPYSYDSCDSGILPNQTAPGRKGYDDIITYNQIGRKTGLNWNPGMRTPACTCDGEDHPGPSNSIGRGVPELDVLEAQINTNKNTGEASQSLQTAPFDLAFDWSQDEATIYDTDTTRFNTFIGNVYQETISGVSTIPTSAYARSGNKFTTFGVEYIPDFTKSGKGTVTWYLDDKAMWTVTEASFGPQPKIDIGQRFVPLEPMSIIMNLGISRGFQSNLDFNSLEWPAIMRIDYVRIYQPDAWPQNLVSCSPPDYPTSDYIARHPDVYNNPQVVLWNKPKPRNKLTTGC